MRLRCLLISVLLLWAVSGHCEVHEKLTHSQYDVHGDERSSLLSLLTDATPIVFEGRKYHAFTSWNVFWKFVRFVQPDGRCHIASASVELTANMRLPNLVGGSTQQRQAFYPYLSALQTHESGHYQIGKDAADAIDRGIQRLPPESSCHSLDQNANALGYRLLADYQARERQYDQSTGYGKTQGASLAQGR